MSETISKEKAKRGERRSYPVEFIVPLQLEQCLYHIRHQPRGMPLRVIVEPAEDDTIHFKALLWPNSAVQTKSEGKLCRWEGTATHVTGQVTFFFYFSSQFLFGVPILIIVILIFFAIISMYLMRMIPIWSWNYFWIMIMPWIFSQGLFFYLAIVSLKIRDRLNRRAMIIHLKRVLIGTEK